MEPISDDFLNIPEDLRKLAEQLYSKYLLKQQKESQKDVPEVPPVETIEYESIDLNTVNTTDCREIGAEYMCYEMLNRLDLKNFLEHKGWGKKMIDDALISIISRAVASYSEHKTENWLNINSGLLELFDKPSGSINRHDLYRSVNKLYRIKNELEAYLYNKMNTLFDIDDTK